MAANTGLPNLNPFAQAYPVALPGQTLPFRSGEAGNPAAITGANWSPTATSPSSTAAPSAGR
jgi:hypothetical protein